MIYAPDTKVDVAKTRAELERLVLAEGGKNFTTSHDSDRGTAMVAFRLAGHMLLFELQLPKVEDFRFKPTRRSYGPKPERTDAERAKAWEQACRAKWRALLFTVKAKLVSVAAGVETFEDAFLGSIMVNNDGRAQRFSTLAVKAIAESYRGNGLPQLIAGAPQ